MACDADRTTLPLSFAAPRFAVALVALVALSGCTTAKMWDPFGQPYFRQVFTSINNQWAAALSRIPSMLGACTNSNDQGETVQDLLPVLANNVTDYREAFDTVMADDFVSSRPRSGPRTHFENATTEIEDLTHYDNIATATLNKITQLAANCPEANARKPMNAAQWRDTFWDVSSP